LNGLASAAWRQSEVVDNTVDLFLDALVGGSIQIGAVSARGSIDILAYALADGAGYSGGVGAVDQAIVWGTTGSTSILGYAQLIPVGTIDVDSGDDDKYCFYGPFSVAACFGGVMPSKWGLVFRNNTGATLGTGASNTLKYLGVKQDVG
jgi:hypothetical protein